ncbi:MAG: ABC transporter permease [Candidatus Manganitrophus sp.]|nr:MAG: ABC transporter permease [Candidatus Manganitrophus sp.]
MELIVLTKASFQTLAIVESVSALQNAVEGNRKHWISEIRPLQESAVQKQTLPTWVLMLVLLVGFMILPAQVAEEKEKKLLLGLLQTPVRETEWLAAKLFLGMILICTGVLFLHLLGRFGFDLGGGLSYAAFLIAGSFCFSAFGIFVGFLCRNQASARTLGVLVYLPHLLPSALSDFSQKLTAVAPLLPSYWFYEPIRSILLEGNRFPNFAPEWAYLFFGRTGRLFFLLFVDEKEVADVTQCGKRAGSRGFGKPEEIKEINIAVRNVLPIDDRPERVPFGILVDEDDVRLSFGRFTVPEGDGKVPPAPKAEAPAESGNSGGIDLCDDRKLSFGNHRSAGRFDLFHQHRPRISADRRGKRHLPQRFDSHRNLLPFNQIGL